MIDQHPQPDARLVRLALPAPPRRERVVRTQLNTKMRVDLLEELRIYTAEQNTTVQGVIEAAVRVYMDAFPPANRPSTGRT